MVERSLRNQSQKEEWVNCLSHGAGVILILVLAPHLIFAASTHGDAISVLGVKVFCITMLLLYGASTAFHGMPHKRQRTKKILNILDHIAVYLLIAGTYTPFMLDAMRGPMGWTLFILIWSLAIIGSVLKVLGRLWKQPYSVAYYLLMGWLVLIAAVPLSERLTLDVLLSLLAGGIFYSVGVYFYLLHHRNYAHFIWHLFVLAGTIAHMYAVLGIYRS